MNSFLLTLPLYDFDDEGGFTTYTWLAFNFSNVAFPRYHHYWDTDLRPNATN
jgi:hypothetical protein